MVAGVRADRPPGRIGPYEIVAELGRGGMGVVYAARDPRLGRAVAIKVLSEDLVHNREWSLRFRREARVLASLNHPNIATIHSLERDGDLEFLTMELIRGRNLASLIDSGSLSLPEALAVGRQIARALEAAHEAGVVHRDLKPLNVMVTPESHVKVLDFGLATTLAGSLLSEAVLPAPSESTDRDAGREEIGAVSTPNSTTAEDGDPLDATAVVDAAPPDEPPSGPHGPRPRAASVTTGAGTPGYMSPEQIRGEELDSRSDVWAFGCVLYELLTGTRIFEGATPIERLRSSLGEIPRLDLPERTPELIRALLRSCLEKDRQARLGSMKDAREVLEAALAQRAWEAPALAASPAPVEMRSQSHNLPHDVSSFVGRTREVSQVRGLLRETRLVTIVGVGGGGKTRVALRVAEEALSDFPDGVWLVELAPVAEAVHVAAAVARALGLTETAGRSLVDTITEHVAGRCLLLVLDNCEHVIDAAAKLALMLIAAAPRLKILATSRETLGLAGETVFSLPPLDLISDHGAPAERLLESEAVQLFAQRAAQVLPSFRVSDANVREVNEICRRLDGIPLAIELAAARVRVLYLQEIARRLDDRFRLLRGGSRSASAHHQTLEALIDWSHGLLTGAEQALFRRLSVFRAGWTLEAAESVCADEDLEAWEVLDVLTRLIDKSLVVFAAPRYRMLETVRQYAWSRLLSTSDAEPVQARFRDHFTEFVERAAQDLVGARQPEALARLDTEIDNVRAVFARILETGEAHAALRIGGASLRYWLIRGQFQEGRNALERVLALPGAETPSTTLGSALNALGSCHYQLHELDAAARRYRQAVEVLRAVGAPQRAGIPLINLGNVHRAKGELDAAAASLMEALEVLEDSDRWMIAAANANLGSVAIVRERYDEAAKYTQIALAIQRELGDRLHEANTLMTLGLVAHKTGRFADARAIYEECLAILDALGDRDIAPIVRSNLGTTLLLLEEDAGARDAFARALRTVVETGNVEIVASSLEGFAQLAQRAGDEPRSVRLCAAADRIRRESGAHRVPSDQPEWDEYLTRIEQELGTERFTGLWRDGASLERAAAIAYALQEAGTE